MTADTKTRWRIARLLNHTNRCWADLVTWALGWHGLREVSSEARCVQHSLTERSRRCYCGKYQNGCKRTPEATS